jgi:hypothetical protein
MPRRNAVRKTDSVDSKFVIRDYNQVVQTAELRDIKLVASVFSVSPEYYAGQPEALDMILSDKLDWVNFDEAGTLATASFDWSADCKRDDEDLLSVSATYIIAYAFSASAGRRYVEAFIQNVGRFALYPYFRALVAQFSAASSADLPVLPIIKQPIANPPGTEGEKPQEPKRARRQAPRSE